MIIFSAPVRKNVAYYDEAERKNGELYSDAHFDFKNDVKQNTPYQPANDKREDVFAY